MLGRAVVEAFSAQGRNVLGFSRQELDVTDPAACRQVVAQHRPATVINCAGYTKVDQAEDEEDLARLINADGAGYLAEAAAEAEAKVVYFSTDFVFDGQKGKPYNEDDPPAPLSAYGRSKWAGEEATRRANSNHMILRTAWLFGPHGNNFVKTILRLAGEKEELRVVDDQVGSPTFTLDLAASLPGLLDLGQTGTYHLTNQGQTTWFGLAARAIKKAGHKVCLIPITSDQIGRKAIRPAFSALNCGRLKALGVSLRPWEEAVDDYVGPTGRGL